jgi:hypothetical protein
MFGLMGIINNMNKKDKDRIIKFLKKVQDVIVNNWDEISLVSKNGELNIQLDFSTDLKGYNLTYMSDRMTYPFQFTIMEGNLIFPYVDKLFNYFHPKFDKEKSIFRYFVHFFDKHYEEIE